MICDCGQKVTETIPEGIFHLVDGAYVSGNLQPFQVVCGNCMQAETEAAIEECDCEACEEMKTVPEWENPY